jgi:hypothetical protein
VEDNIKLNVRKVQCVDMEYIILLVIYLMSHFYGIGDVPLDSYNHGKY